MRAGRAIHAWARRGQQQQRVRRAPDAPPSYTRGMTSAWPLWAYTGRRSRMRDGVVGLLVHTGWVQARAYSCETMADHGRCGVGPSANKNEIWDGSRLPFACGRRSASVPRRVGWFRSSRRSFVVGGGKSRAGAREQRTSTRLAPPARSPSAAVCWGSAGQHGRPFTPEGKQLPPSSSCPSRLTPPAQISPFR